MSTRTTVLAASVLTLLLAFNLTSAAAGPPRGTSSKGPTNLRLTVNGPYSITLNWDAGKSSSNSWWYCIQRDGLGCIRVDPPTTTFTFSKLWPNTTFNYSVVIVESSGKRSAPSNTVTYTTPPDTTPPSAPTLSVNGTWPTRVWVSWTQSVESETSGGQVWYTLLVNGTPYVSDAIGQRFALVMDRTPATEYTFEVTARDFFQNTSRSNVETVTTPPVTDFEPPSTPTNLRLSFQTSQGENWLEWDQSTDNVDPQSQIEYEFFLNGKNLGDFEIGVGEGIAYCRGEVAPTTIAVRAVDTSGNASGFSNEIVGDC
jgi:hypothetical protein